MCFLKSSQNFNKLFFETIGCFTLVVSEKGWKLFDLVDFVVKPNQSIVSTKESIVFLKTLIEFC